MRDECGATQWLLRVLLSVAVSWAGPAAGTLAEVMPAASMGTSAGDVQAMSLQEALTIATERYRPARIAREQVMLAQMRLVEAQRNFFPRVSLTWAESDGQIGSTEFSGRDYKAEFDQPVFHSGELFHAYRQARANYQLAKHRYDRVKLDLVQDVARAYYQLALAIRNHQMRSELIRDLEAERNLAQAAYARDAMSAVDWLNARSVFQQAELEATASAQEIALARLDLQRALGWEDGQRLAAEPEVRFVLRYIPIDLPQAIQLAFEHRPEFLMQQAAEQAARAKGGPKVDLRASVGKGSEVPRPQDFDFERQWFIGLEGSIPLGPSTAEYEHSHREDFPRLSATQSTNLRSNKFGLNIWDNQWQIEHQEARVALEQAGYDFSEEAAQLRREVQEAYYLYQRSLVDIEATLSRIEFQEKDVAIRRFRAAHQEASVPEVMEAKVRLVQERLAHHRAIIDYDLALVAINKAIGIDNYYKVLE